MKPMKKLVKRPIKAQYSEKVPPVHLRIMDDPEWFSTNFVNTAVWKKAEKERKEKEAFEKSLEEANRNAVSITPNSDFINKQRQKKAWQAARGRDQIEIDALMEKEQADIRATLLSLYDYSDVDGTEFKTQEDDTTFETQDDDDTTFSTVYDDDDDENPGSNIDWNQAGSAIARLASTAGNVLVQKSMIDSAADKAANRLVAHKEAAVRSVEPIRDIPIEVLQARQNAIGKIKSTYRGSDPIMAQLANSQASESRLNAREQLGIERAAHLAQERQNQEAVKAANQVEYVNTRNINEAANVAEDARIRGVETDRINAKKALYADALNNVTSEIGEFAKYSMTKKLQAEQRQISDDRYLLAQLIQEKSELPAGMNFPKEDLLKALRDKLSNTKKRHGGKLITR